MGAVVTFSYAAWVARYPEFAAVTAETAGLYFAEACLYHNNTATGPVCDASSQSLFLNMLTAHVAARYSQSAGAPSPGSPQNADTPVGRIASASEGSVSAQFQNDYPPGTPQWYQQTKYGADYWAATKAYRTAYYVPRPTVVVNGVYPFRTARGFGPW